MTAVLTWRDKSGRQRQLETPGLHDRLTGADIRKKFLSLRGYQERQLYLFIVMRSYPLQVAESGLIPFFDGDEKGSLKTSAKIEWLHRLEAYSNAARPAFNELDDRQQKLILLVLPEKRSIEAAARALKISRKHCHNLFWQAVGGLFPDYQKVRARPTLRLLREQLAMLMGPETSWREQSGNSEDYLDHVGKGRGNPERGHDQSDEDGA